MHPPGLLNAHHGADPPGLDLFDDETRLGGDLASDARGARMRGSEHVVGVAVGHLIEPAVPDGSTAAGHAA